MVVIVENSDISTLCWFVIGSKDLEFWMIKYLAGIVKFGVRGGHGGCRKKGDGSLGCLKYHEFGIRTAFSGEAPTFININPLPFCDRAIGIRRAF